MGQNVDEMVGSWYVAKCLGVFIYESLCVILSIILTFAWKIWVLPLESVALWPRLKSETLRVKFANVTATANLHGWQEVPHLTKDLTVNEKRVAQKCYVLRKIHRRDEPPQKFYPVESNRDERWSRGLLYNL
jgi:hypothetical protein